MEKHSVHDYMHRPYRGALMASYIALICLLRHAETDAHQP